MEKQQGKKPQIRFPEFKELWEHKKLSELLSEAKKRNEDLKYGKDEVLSVSGELGIVNQIEHLGRSYAGVSVHQYHIVEIGDIVYTKSPLKANPFGIIKLNKGKAGIVSTLYAVYKVNKKTAYGPFIDYYFSLDANTNRYLRPLVKKGAKNDMKINNAYVLHDRIFAPSIPEQTRIASFFTVLDKKTAQLKQKKILLEQYKKGVMQKLFSQELRFKDENGKEFPKWEKKKLGDVCEIIMGQSPSSNSYNLNEIGIPLIQGNADIQNRLSNPRNWTTEKTKECKLGDLILTVRAPVGAVAKSIHNACIGRGVCAIRNNSKSKIEFIYQFLLDFEAKWSNLEQGSTFTAVSGIEIKKIGLLIPCLAEQTRISNFLAAIDERINHCQQQIEKTEKWKKGLLQKMFV
jgi:type I restriction enzyme S subunit